MSQTETVPRITHPQPPYRVLIVDDDYAQAEMVSEFLRISGYHGIDHAPTISRLWELLKQGSYDIVLLDYHLPDGTGLEVLDQLPRRGCTTPVVMVTGKGDERIAVQAIQRGAANYLLKSDEFLLSLPALIHKTVQAHHLQQSIERSQEQIRYQALLLSQVRDAIVVWDQASRITYWNPAASALYGFSAEERLGRPVGQFYLSTLVPPINPSKDSDPSGRHITRKFVHRDGRTLWVSSQVTALNDPSNPERLLGYMDVSHDITRRIEAETALRENEARYRAIVDDYQTELICRFKPNGMLTFANEVFCRYFGKSRDELVGMNFLYFIPENERPRLIQHLSSFGPERTVGILEHQIMLPEQGLRWLQRKDRAILDDHGRIFEFQSVARDITEHKGMESQIQAAQAHLIQAARLATIGEVASGVAHQIYNPLTTIIADAQILLRKLPPDQDGRDSAEAIQEAGWRLQAAVARLLEFSRPTAENLAPVSINQTIQSAISLVHTSIEALGCRLEIHLAPDLPAVRGSFNQLENLWVNLLLLARDAVTPAAEPDNGRIQAIRQEPCIQLISRLDPRGMVVAEVCDNGRPIPQDQLATIFEPNFVGPSGGRGTGLELSICREIVRQHSGHIEAECCLQADQDNGDDKTGLDNLQQTDLTNEDPSIDSQENSGSVKHMTRNTIIRVLLPVEV